jgi:Cytochrome c554 and c-prime
MNDRLKCCLLLVLAAGSLSLDPPLTQSEAVAIEEVTPGRGGPSCWLGVSSCTAASCHGGGIKGARGSEWNTFADCDSHYRAYGALLDERSTRIMKNLNDPTPAHQQSRCLVCHAMEAGRTRHGPRFSLADGVGCESCHGPAQKWLTTHYLPEWQQLSPAAKAAVDFFPTKDLVARARLCADCHVGKGDQEVNHDLIAAGHPRLNFEYASYLAIYPKHWSERAEKAAYPDLEARAWAIGQVVSAQAALELLAHRAANSNKNPWPEFAEYNCFACHKELPGTAPKRRPNGPPGFGSIPWSDWYYSMLERALSGPRTGEVKDTLEKVRGEMNKRNPDRVSIAPLARNAAQDLQLPLTRLCKAPIEPVPDIRNRLELLLGEKRTNWDRDTQRYLAMAALHHALGDLAPDQRDPGWKKELMDLAGKLAFPKGQDSPGR